MRIPAQRPRQGRHDAVLGKTPSTGAARRRRSRITFPRTAIWLPQAIIAWGDKINVCVPTGNFGNILAAYIAKKMGLPVNKFICASTRNNVLTDFFKEGGEVQPQPRFLHHHVAVDGHPDFVQPRASAVLRFRLQRQSWSAELMGKAEYRGQLQGSRGCILPRSRLSSTQAAATTVMRLIPSTKLWKDGNYLQCDTHTAVTVRVIYEDYRTHRRRNADRDRIHRVSVQVLPLRLSGRSAARSRTTTLPSWRCSLS